MVKWILGNGPEEQENHFSNNEGRVSKRVYYLSFLFKFSGQVGREMTKERRF